MDLRLRRSRCGPGRSALGRRRGPAGSSASSWRRPGRPGRGLLPRTSCGHASRSGRRQTLGRGQLGQVLAGQIEHTGGGEPARLGPQLGQATSSARGPSTGVNTRPLWRAIAGPDGGRPGRVVGADEQQRGRLRCRHLRRAGRRRCGPWSTAGWFGRCARQYVDEVGEPVGRAARRPRSGCGPRPATRSRRPRRSAAPARRGTLDRLEVVRHRLAGSAWSPAARPRRTPRRRGARRTRSAACRAWARSSRLPGASPGRRRTTRPARPRRRSAPAATGRPSRPSAASAPRAAAKSPRKCATDAQAPPGPVRPGRVGVGPGQRRAPRRPAAGRPVEVADEPRGLGRAAEHGHALGTVGEPGRRPRARAPTPRAPAGPARPTRSSRAIVMPTRTSSRPCAPATSRAARRLSSSARSRRSVARLVGAEHAASRSRRRPRGTGRGTRSSRRLRARRAPQLVERGTRAR